MENPASLYQKEARYYQSQRVEMTAFIPPQAKILLDVGCGAGGFGRLLKQQRPALTIWGVEPVEEHAAIARQVLDQVQVGLYPEGLDLPEAYFDCISFNDVLEHMLDPWQALRRSHDFLKPEGYVVASIPNIRFLPYLFRLAFYGEWEYRDAGILDRTHLRFFTKQSMLKMFADTGYRVLRVEGTHPDNRLKTNLVRRLLPRSEELKYHTFAILAQRQARP